MTVSLPPDMVKEVEKVRKMEHRTRSELVREALRNYFLRYLPAAEGSKAEVLAIQRGRAEFRRGKYVTLDQLTHALEPHPRSVSRKTA